jgi:hypothetical protein
MGGKQEIEMKDLNERREVLKIFLQIIFLQITW